MKELPKTYNPQEVEKTIYPRWEKSGFFNPDNLPWKKGEPFVISMPPPNVTGDLHLGHALATSLEDLMIRYHRMNKKQALWVPGTDHAGISTQIVVERLLAKGGINRHEVGRQTFLKHVWAWKKKYGGRIIEQIKGLGASCDWSREHFTMDENLTKAIKTAFITLYNDGLIYQGKRIISWCTRCQTALSDLEVTHKEKQSFLWHIKYPIIGTADKFIEVATTRPETMLGDTAVVVNPKDRRYKRLIGKKALLPLVNREIPIIADSQVDIEFGTGAVKVTPAHDDLDYQISQRHNLPQVQVIGFDGKMTKESSESFFGLRVKGAREKVLTRLRQHGFLTKIENYVHSVGYCERCNTTIEPMISKQWFIKMEGLAKEAVRAIKQGKIKIIPKRFTKVYFHFLNNIQDWCISRQLWWGHQIPVWYCGGVKLGHEKKMGFHKKVVPQVFKGKTKTYRLRDKKLAIGEEVLFLNSQTEKIFGQGIIINIEKVKIDEIRLDDKAHGATYKNLNELIKAIKKHYPHEIVKHDTEIYIYTYKFTPKNRLKGCGQAIASLEKPKICPHCKNKNLKQDEDTLDTWFSSSLWTFSTLGWPQKTSDLKSFHPTQVMETGWDILFFWVARMVMMSLYLLGEVPFKTVYLHGLVLDKDGKKMSKSKGTGVDPEVMLNKYGTDALRLSLVLGTTAGQDFRLYEEKIAGYRNFCNKLWNIARFTLTQGKPKNQTIKAKTLADQWILHELNVLTKTVNKHLEKFEFSMAGEALYEFAWHKLADWYLEINKTEKNQTVLYYCLETVLRLLHPYIPFITEEIWQKLYPKKLLMVEEWPKENKSHENKKAAQDFKKIQSLIIKLRNTKKAKGLKPKDEFTVKLKKSPLITKQKEIIEWLARVRLDFN